MTNPHGGKRPNAGRKPGSGAGRKTVSRSVSLTTEQWEKIDRLSGGNRSRWIAQEIDKNPENT